MDKTTIGTSLFLGTVTALLCYIKADRMYCQGREPLKIKTLITLMVDVALIMSTRQATRMFSPPAAFSYIFTKEGYRIGKSFLLLSQICINISTFPVQVLSSFTEYS